MLNNVHNLQKKCAYSLFLSQKSFLANNETSACLLISDVCRILKAEAVASYLDLLQSNLLTCYDDCKRI